MLATSVHTSDVVLVVAVFLACAVEMVEALTIVVAVGVTRGWRTSLEGAAAALVLLAGAVGAVGPAIVHLVPLDGLRVVIGALLLAFGAQWLRKAVLRASGRKALHDEDAIYAATVRQLSETGTEDGGSREEASKNEPAGARRAGRDWTALGISFKGVLLEGLEVVVIVLTLGTAAHRVGLAAGAAIVALVVVAGVGATVARHLSRVPENTMKMAVGIMLTSFGTFWLAEGLGLGWPGGDAFLLALVGAYGLVVWAARALLRSGVAPSEPAPVAPAPTSRSWEVPR